MNRAKKSLTRRLTPLGSPNESPQRGRGCPCSPGLPTPEDDAEIMDESRESHPARLGPLVLLVVSGCLFFLRLDSALLEPEEARYAEIPREMLVADEWIVPQYHGQAYFDKPPLLYWLVMLSYSAFGVHDWAARLVPGCCGVSMVLIAFLWGRSAFGARAGFLGALVLALSARFVYLGRLVATDAPLSLCVVTALAGAHAAILGPSLRWRWWLVSAFACGMGLLAKGPVTFVLVGVPLLGYLLLKARTARPRWGAVAVYLGVALATALPWYAAVMVRDPNFAEYFFWKHHVVRYVAPFDHAKPFWFYLPDFFAGTLPWSPLLVPLAVGLWKQRGKFRDRQPPEIALPLLASVWCVLFFSLSGSKRVGYILPAFAPFALVIGEQIDRLLTHVSPTRKQGKGTSPRPLRARRANAGVEEKRVEERPGPLIARRANDGVEEKRVEERPSRWLRTLPFTVLGMGAAGTVGLASFEYISFTAAVVGATAILSMALIFVIQRRRLTPLAGLYWCAVLSFAGCFVGVQWILPEYAERFSLRRVVVAARSESPAASVICYPRGWDSVSFYLERDDVKVFTERERADLFHYLEANPDTLIFLRDGEPAKKLLEELPPAWTFVERDRQGNTIAGRIHLAPRGE